MQETSVTMPEKIEAHKPNLYFRTTVTGCVTLVVSRYCERRSDALDYGRRTGIAPASDRTRRFHYEMR